MLALDVVKGNGKSPLPRYFGLSTPFHKYGNVCGWVLRGEVAKRGGGDAGTSATTRDKEIARNPHPPEGLGRDGPISLLLLLAPRSGLRRAPNKRYQIYASEYLARDNCSTHRFWKDPTSMELKKQILEKDPTAISSFVDQMWWNKGMNHIDCFQAVSRILSVSFHKYGDICWARASRTSQVSSFRSGLKSGI